MINCCLTSDNISVRARGEKYNLGFSGLTTVCIYSERLSSRLDTSYVSRQKDFNFFYAFCCTWPRRQKIMAKESFVYSRIVLLMSAVAGALASIVPSYAILDLVR